MLDASSKNTGNMLSSCLYSDDKMVRKRRIYWLLMLETSQKNTVVKKNVKFFQNNGIFNLLDKGYSFSSFFGSRVSLYKESSLKTSNAFCNTLSSFNPDNNSPFW